VIYSAVKRLHESAMMHLTALEDNNKDRSSLTSEMQKLPMLLADPFKYRRKREGRLIGLPALSACGYAQAGGRQVGAESLCLDRNSNG
jgi:hypothetical protein